MISQGRILNRSVGLAAAFLAVAGQLQAQQPPVEIGPELFLPQPTSSCQHFTPRAAFGPRGGALIVWTHFGVAARYLPRGAEVPGPQFQISTTGGAPAVAAAGEGSFWIAWRNSAFGQDSELFLQHFDSDGLPLSSQSLVTTYPHILSHTLATGPDGDVYVAWTEAVNHLWRLKLQRYGSDGLQVGDEILLDTLDEIGHGLGAPQIAIRESGDLLIAWTRDLTGIEILGRGFTRELQPLGDTVQLASPGSGWQEAAVAPFGDGYLFGWTESFPEAAIFTRIADLAAVPAGPIHRIDDAGGGTPRFGGPRLSTYQGGQPLVVWVQETEDPESTNAWGRLLDSEGAPTGPELLLNDPVAETFGTPGAAVLETAVATGPLGRFLTLWQVAIFSGVGIPDPCDLGQTVMTQQYQHRPSRLATDTRRPAADR